MLTTAIRPANSYNSLNFIYVSKSSTNQYRVLLHFADEDHAQQSQLIREFSISVNGVKTGRFRLPYLKPFSWSSKSLTIQGDISITLDATPKSDLPPIVNAIEIYKLLHFSFSATHQSDRTYPFISHLIPKQLLMFCQMLANMYTRRISLPFYFGGRSVLMVSRCLSNCFNEFWDHLFACNFVSFFYCCLVGIG